ncbi:potassium transporter peripheral membrane component, partial [mine drainage metagenome]
RGEQHNSGVIGRTVQEIELPEGPPIGAIVRGEEVIMAHHDARVQANDHLILFLPDRRHIDAVERLFTRVAP